MRELSNSWGSRLGRCIQFIDGSKLYTLYLLKDRQWVHILLWLAMRHLVLFCRVTASGLNAG